MPEPVPHPAKPVPIDGSAGAEIRELSLVAPPARGLPWGALAAFALLVLVPIGAAVWYLWWEASERYASRAAFSIRSADSAPALEIFGAMTQIGGNSTMADGQILYDFIQSQQIVRQIRPAGLDAMWQRADDPLFGMARGLPIEEIHDHWARMVDIALEPSTGILTLEVRAFDPGDAQRLAAAVLEASGQLVNTLSDGARDDAVRFARQELETAESRLRGIRTEMLQRRLDSRDSRLTVEQARQQAARTGRDARTMAATVGEHEELLLNREFAEQAYKMALATYEQAAAEARRRHRYLAVHIQPTLSEQADYPDRPVWLLTIALSGLAAWAVLMLIVGNLRERR